MACTHCTRGKVFNPFTKKNETCTFCQGFYNNYNITDYNNAPRSVGSRKKLALVYLIIFLVIIAALGYYTKKRQSEPLWFEKSSSDAKK